VEGLLLDHLCNGYILELNITWDVKWMEVQKIAIFA